MNPAPTTKQCRRLGAPLNPLHGQVTAGRLHPVLRQPTAHQLLVRLAISDQTVVRALNFIRNHAGEPLQADQVARQYGTSRRALERRFAQLLDRSPAEEIRRAHIEEAKKLLLETHLTIPEVADAAGFGSPEYMAHVFRTQLHKTPSQYRCQIPRKQASVAL